MAPGPPDDPQPSRRRIFAHPGRVALVIVTLLVVVNLGAWLLVSSETGTPGRALPERIESLMPGPGDVAQAQDTVTVDLRSDLTGVLVINGLEIPEDQLERNAPLGVVSFRPGPDKDFDRWPTGDITVEVVTWPQTDERPDDPDRYGWTFRVG